MKEKNLFTWDGYYSTYCYFLGEGYYSSVAWQKTEDQYKELTGGVGKYKNFNSFSSAMSQRFKKSN